MIGSFGDLKKLDKHIECNVQQKAEFLLIY